jgi:hypothetical protein
MLERSIGMMVMVIIMMMSWRRRRSGVRGGH